MLVPCSPLLLYGSVFTLFWRGFGVWSLCTGGHLPQEGDLLSTQSVLASNGTFSLGELSSDPTRKAASFNMIRRLELLESQFNCLDKDKVDSTIDRAYTLHTNLKNIHREIVRCVCYFVVC
jgi:hypothetical protein